MITLPSVEGQLMVSRVDAGFADGVATGYMSQQAIADFRPAFTAVPKGKRVAVGCGDDRLPAHDSVEFVDRMLSPDAVSIEDNYAGFFGAHVGEVAVIGAAGTATHGPGFISSEGGLRQIANNLIEMRGTLTTIHSDLDSEGQSAHFNFEVPTQDVGCYYNGSFGELMYLIGSEDWHARPELRLVRQVAAENLRYIFGTDERAGALFTGYTAVLHATGGGRRYSFNRTEYARRIKEGMPAIILEDQHAKPLTNGVAVNLGVHKVSSPRAIRELTGPRHYRNDLGRVALEIKDLLDYYRIPSKTFLQTATVGITPVRAALAAHGTGMTDPRLVPIGVYGNAKDTVRYLNQIK